MALIEGSPRGVQRIPYSAIDKEIEASKKSGIILFITPRGSSLNWQRLNDFVGPV
jgi:hypothetical protein